MIRQCLWIPQLETRRLILRKLEPEDAADLQEWLYRPEVYTYWGTPLGKGEHDARKLFIDPRPHVKRCRRVSGRGEWETGIAVTIFTE